VRCLGGKGRVREAERFQDDLRSRLGERRSGHVGDQLAEHRTAAVAGVNGAARAGAGDNRAHELGQVRDGVGVHLGGAVHPGGVAEQFPDRDGVVGQPYRAQVIVGGAVQADGAVRDQLEDGGGGDEHGDAGGREPVAGVQGLAAVQVGPAPGEDPRGPRVAVAAGQEEGGQAQLGDGLFGYLGYSGGHLALGADRGVVDPGVADPPAHRQPAQADQAVRRLGLHRRDVLHVGQLRIGLQRGLAEDGELAVAQVRGELADGRDKLGRRERGQEPVAEVLLQLVVGGSGPARFVGSGETRDHPAQLVQRVAVFITGLLGVDPQFEGRPARQAVLARDGQLGFVQGRELARGHATFGLELEVAKVRPAGQRSRPTGHGSPSLTPGVRLLRAGKTRRRSQSCTR
jgi:hypothetical protein